MKSDHVERKEGRCVICGGKTQGENVCECCAESLALVDIENLLSGKRRGAIFPKSAANAFK